MDFSNAPADLLINIFAGIVGAFIILIVFEKKKGPKLKIGVGPTHETKTFTLLRVSIHNQKMGKPLSWLYEREPAFLCRAWINFYYDSPDNEPIHSGMQMVAKWSDTPVPVREISEGKTIYDGFMTRDTFDIPADSSALLDIAGKFNDENDCFGWSNKSYEFPQWKNTDWRLNKNTYIVRVNIVTGGKQFTQFFRLINENYPLLEHLNDPNLDKRLK